MAKKYFERPPPIDLAFGDPIKAHDGFNDKSIYLWSIDGLHPEQINRMDVRHEPQMPIFTGRKLDGVNFLKSE